MKLCAVLSPSPEPVPTVTVTETVAPIPAPTIYVKVPDGWDPVHDMLLSDFGGALLGVVVTVLLAIGLFLWERHDRREDSKQLRADRDADLERAEQRIREDRRFSAGNQLADAIATLTTKVSGFNHAAELRPASVAALGWVVRVADLYADDEEHGPFSEWIKREGRHLHFKIMIVTVELGKPQDDRDSGLLDFLTSEITTDLMMIEKSVFCWIKGGPWEPQLDHRLSWEEEKKEMALQNRIPAMPNLNKYPVTEEQVALLKTMFMVGSG